jgi:amino acid transporter
MSLKSILIGRPIETEREKHERLSKTLGLAVFASDALSSVAYATEEILLVLVLAGTTMLHYSMPIGIGIAVLIAIVAISYRQTIHAYPSGGGSYIVAKDNLGINAGLVAAAALLIDYVLTVAVSITAGVEAITSAVPALQSHAVMLSMFSLLILTVGNLRGVKESGKIFAVPTYVFIGSITALVIYGIFKYFYLPHPPLPEYKEAPAGGILPIFLVMRAFASGCTALTGIEAVSNGVKAFKKPEARNASMTLTWMAAILGAFFIGITFLSNHYGILPSESETVLSQLAHAVFSNGILYYIVQISTFLILILAANTSFADFPRLSSIMAMDGYMPRQLSNRGDKLVFSNGILLLSLFSAILIIGFGGETHALIPLYAVGVFLAFTLSQIGMVKHWIDKKGDHWQKSAVINGIGGITTAVVLIVIAGTKFMHGAWLVIIAIPTIVYLTKQVKSHYRSVATQLSLEGHVKETEFKHHSVIIPISGVQKAVIHAVKYAKALSDDVAAVYVCLDPEETKRIQDKWLEYGMGVPLIVLESPYRSIMRPFLDFLDEVHARYKMGVITVIMPEFVPQKWWHHLLHNQTALLIKGVLTFKKGIVSTSVPFHLSE